MVSGADQSMAASALAKAALLARVHRDIYEAVYRGLIVVTDAMTATDRPYLPTPARPWPNA